MAMDAENKNQPEGRPEPKVPTMFAEERRAAIMDMLARDVSVQVADIAQEFGVSPVTARHDLAVLERAGKLRRTHGGAVALKHAVTVSVQEQRVNVQVRAKQAIARAAVERVRDGESLLVDSGTTGLEFVRLLGNRRNVTVITDDITIACYIDESLPNVEVMLLGGVLRKGHRYLYGPFALRSLELLRVDKALIFPTALSCTHGLMCNFVQMAEVKAAYLRAARERIVLADSSKIDAAGLIRFAGLEEVDTLIMDADPDGAVAAALEALASEGRAAPELLIATP